MSKSMVKRLLSQLADEPREKLIDIIAKLEQERTDALGKLGERIRLERRLHSAAELIGEALDRDRERDDVHCPLDVAEAAVWLAEYERALNLPRQTDELAEINRNAVARGEPPLKTV